MPPVFDRAEVLRSAQPPTQVGATFAMEFALLGYVDLARDLVSTLNTAYPFHGLEAELQPLHLAWAASGQWPDGIPEHDQGPDAVAELAAEYEQNTWAEEDSEDERMEDAAAVEKLLKRADSFEDSDAREGAESIEKSECLVRALNTSIKLMQQVAGTRAPPPESLDERGQGILKRIAERLHCGQQLEALAQCPQAWPYLVKGALARAVGIDNKKVETLGKDVTSTIKEWFQDGPQPAKKSDKSIKALLETCSAKSIEHWSDNFDEGEQAPKTLFADSNASDKDISDLENRLGIELPGDYKEFLGITNGFKRILADDLYETELYAAKDVKRLLAQDIAEFLEQDEDEFELDDLDEEDEESADEVAPAAKKLKLGHGLHTITNVSSARKEDKESIGDKEDSESEPEGLPVDLLSSLPKEIMLQYIGEHEKDWPTLTQAFEIGGTEAVRLWLLDPNQVRRARDAYLDLYEKAEGPQKSAVRWAMIGFAGSEEAFKGLTGWCVVGCAAGDISATNAWSSFRAYLEDMAEGCEKAADADNEVTEDTGICVAYSCR